MIHNNLFLYDNTLEPGGASGQTLEYEEMHTTKSVSSRKNNGFFTEPNGLYEVLTVRSYTNSSEASQDNAAAAFKQQYLFSSFNLRTAQLEAKVLYRKKFRM